MFDDLENSRLLISTILDTFTGKRIELPQYQQDYSESEFEVITETYNWGRAVLQGWLIDRRESRTLYNEHIL